MFRFRYVVSLDLGDIGGKYFKDWTIEFADGLNKNGREREIRGYLQDFWPESLEEKRCHY